MSVIYDSTGISIQVYSSLFTGLSPLFGLNSEIEGYSHQVDVDGGYAKAAVDLSCSIEEGEEWFENGLLRHIEAKNEAGKIIWEGFVDSVSLSIGGLQIKRGPVTDIRNNVAVTYTRLDTSVDPPVTGGQNTTTWARNLPSIARYGWMSESISGGTITDLNAEQIRDTFIAERQTPPVSQDIDLGGGEAVKISLDCCGYVEYLSRNFYTLESVAMTTASAKIMAVLTSEVNAVVLTDFSRIATNTLAVPAAEAKWKTERAIISDIVSYGDDTYTRYVFGIYAGRKAVYQPIPAAIEYQYQVAPNESAVELYGGGEVYPWNVLPGKWMFYSNFLPGRGAVGSDLTKDPRVQFIESITYTAPWGLQISGGHLERLSQRLAQLTGLKGA